MRRKQNLKQLLARKAEREVAETGYERSLDPGVAPDNREARRWRERQNKKRKAKKS